eukprot:6204038-Pleurochrysis_carterae.AAC.1
MYAAVVHVVNMSPCSNQTRIIWADPSFYFPFAFKLVHNDETARAESPKAITIDSTAFKFIDHKSLDVILRQPSCSFAGFKPDALILCMLDKICLDKYRSSTARRAGFSARSHKSDPAPTRTRSQ